MEALTTDHPWEGLSFLALFSWIIGIFFFFAVCDFVMLLFQNYNAPHIHRQSGTKTCNDFFFLFLFSTVSCLSVFASCLIDCRCERVHHHGHSNESWHWHLQAAVQSRQASQEDWASTALWNTAVPPPWIPWSCLTGDFYNPDENWLSQSAWKWLRFVFTFLFEPFSWSWVQWTNEYLNLFYAWSHETCSLI